MFKVEINYQVKTPLKYEALFKKYGQKTLSVLRLKKSMEVSVAFVSPAQIKQANNIYRHKNKVTDVLSFEILNEILICPGKAIKQAPKFKRSAKEEICLLFVHGLLHLLGYDDQTDKEALVMERLADKILV